MSYPLQVAKIKAKRKLIEEDGPVPEDGFLYKYRSLKKGPERKNTLAILKNNQLWWGRGSNFNDPFDCSHHIDYERTDEEWEEFFARGFDKGLQFVRSKIAEAKAHVRGERPSAKQIESPAEKSAGFDYTITDKAGNPISLSTLVNRSRGKSLKKTLHRLDKRFGVLCLSYDPDNILLWSHYANSHSGVCLQFDIAAHRKAFPRLHPVTYQTDALDLAAPMQDLFSIFSGEPKLLLDIASTMRGSDAQNDEPARKIEQWFYTKSIYWEYEQEWRALVANPGLNRFPARALTGVIVGCVNTEENLALVRKAVDKKRPRPKVYVASKKRDEFGLDIQLAD